jgi:acyl carrier protein
LLKKDIKMNENELLLKTKKVFKIVFGESVPPLTAELSAKDVEGWDSIGHIDLILALEEEFNIEISALASSKLKNIGELLNLIKKTLSNR